MLGRVLLVVVVLWIGGYVLARSMLSETWAQDGRSYVVFPADGVGRLLYLIWRPLSVIDERLTGRGTHLGPHR